MSRTKLRILIITIVLLLIAFSTIFASTITHFSPEYGETTTNVNFRSMPETNYNSYIKTLKSGDKLKVVGTIDNYYIVQLETNEIGLVSKEYVKITGEKTNNLDYEDYSPFYVVTNGDRIILRGGPSTNFRVITILPKDEKLLVIGKIDNFYLVITQNNTVGMVRDDLVNFTEENMQQIENNEKTNKEENQQASNETIPTDEYILSIINQKRKEAGLPELSIDSLLDSVAQNKTEDMVKLGYFDHNSPTYGSPFEMMQSAGVTYITAGENIAGNSSVDNAINSFLESSEHRKNILSNSYNYIGIGIEKSDIYGYIIVLMFIGK